MLPQLLNVKLQTLEFHIGLYQRMLYAESMVINLKWISGNPTCCCYCVGLESAPPPAICHLTTE